MSNKAITLTEQLKPTDIIIGKGFRELFKDEDFIKMYHNPLTLQSLKEAINNDKKVKNTKSNKSNKR